MFKRISITALLAALTVSATLALGARPALAACPRYGKPSVAGNVHISGINEISGVIAGHRADVLWAIEDSGNPERLYAVSATGKTRANMTVRRSNNRDWEDIAYGRGAVWIGDIGSRRSVVAVYWFKEPRLGRRAVRAKSANLRYQRGRSHNAEAMFIVGANLFIVTKERSAWEGIVYRAPIKGLRHHGARMLRRIGKVAIGNVTGADAGPRGFIVRNLSGRSEFYRWRAGKSVASALKGRPCTPTVGRGESIAFSRWNRRLYTIPEGSTPQVRFIARR